MVEDTGAKQGSVLLTQTWVMDGSGVGWDNLVPDLDLVLLHLDVFEFMESGLV